MEDNSLIEASLGDASKHAPTDRLAFMQHRAAGDAQPREKANVLEDSVALVFNGSWRIIYVKRDGQICMLTGLPAGDPEPVNNGDPYDKAVPILREDGSDSIRTALNRPRVTAVVFKHEINRTDQLRIYYVDNTNILRELCKGSDPDQQKREFYPGALEQKGWRVAQGSPLTCSCDGKILKLFYSRANQQGEEQVYVAWAPIASGMWNTRAIT